MVPLKPNELSRDVLDYVSTRQRSARAIASTGMRNDDPRDDTMDDKWAFNLRGTDMDILEVPSPGGSREPAQLRVDDDDPRRERPDRERRETRGRGRRLQVAHVRLERCALELLHARDVRDSFAERPRSSADLAGIQKIHSSK